MASGTLATRRHSHPRLCYRESPADPASAVPPVSSSHAPPARPPRVSARSAGRFPIPPGNAQSDSRTPRRGPNEREESNPRTGTGHGPSLLRRRILLEAGFLWAASYVSDWWRGLQQPPARWPKVIFVPIRSSRSIARLPGAWWITRRTTVAIAGSGRRHYAESAPPTSICPPASIRPRNILP